MWSHKRCKCGIEVDTQSQNASALCSAAGGKEADKQIRAAIRTALAPAAQAVPARKSLLASSSSNTAYTFQLNHSNRYGNNTGQPCTQLWYDGGDQNCMCAVWPRAELGMEYNIRIMAEPAMHESAAKEILEGDLRSIHPAA